MTFHGPISVFVSSTCYDLIDLRLELKGVLNQNGFIVRLSEDATSAFFVEPTDDSIESCLANVEASDVVVCIIDRRYGGILKNGRFANLSATHSEVVHARSIDPQKPVFFFIRRAAYQEYEHMKRNGWTFKTSWVEPDGSAGANSRRESWFKFVTDIAGLPKHQNWSNWCDLFDSSVDLGPLVIKRLFDYFPNQVSVRALQPDRLVRLAYTFLASHANGAVRGFFQNVGQGPALDITHGIRKFNTLTPLYRDGGLAVGTKLCPDDLGRLYETGCSPAGPQCCLYCKYRNAHGDWFRVEIPVAWVNKLPATPGPDRFLVGNSNIPDLQWNRVN